ncbi:MAG: GWxTD domain-containing protein [Candidatus Neomarinimicrobiota bacterium]
MSRSIVILTCLLGILRGTEPSGSQLPERIREESPLKITTSQSPTLLGDSVQLDVFTKIPLDQLVFVSHGENFKATYELSVFAVDENGMVCGTRIWLEEVVKARYKETQSADLHHIAHTDFTLPPDEYNITVSLVDQDNRQSYNASEKIEITGYPRDQLVLGDILLLADIQKRPGQPDNLVPYVDNQISDVIDSFHVHMVIRRPAGAHSEATLEYSLETKDETTVATSSRTLNLAEALSTHIIPVAAGQLKERRYTLKLRVEVDSLEAKQSVPIHVTWAGFSGEIEDIELAIEQTRYVATRAQLQKMRGATGEAKREAFLEFWRALDPTPDTPSNELMDEYYRRVGYANTYFRSFQPGWETDLGMVYIIYGQPDDIERHPFDMQQKPYQVWFYYERGWKFIFVDVNMFGDYRLVTPLYPSRSF